MKLLHSCCAGLDVHKAEVVACLRRARGRTAHHELRRFSTDTPGLLELGDWLASADCTHVAMEATGVYWKPVWHLLEGRFQLILANAGHIRNVPGRKTDINDATWIADLLAHGLVESSFVPPTPIQELRELTRTRKQITREIVRHTQRLQAILETANLKLDSVISQILGLSGRRILNAIIGGETNPEVLADLGHHRLECSREELVRALHGRVTKHHRFLLRQHLRLIEELERSQQEFDEQIDECLRPFADEIERLTGVPGLGPTTIPAIVAEVGLDMQRFPTSAHLISWATLCPRLDESAGKTRSKRTRKGGTWIKPVLLQAARAAIRTPGYYQAQFHRLKARRGAKRATVAVAASLLTAIYYVLRDRVPFHDLGADHFSKRERSVIASRLVRRIAQLGYSVHVQPLQQQI